VPESVNAETHETEDADRSIGGRSTDRGAIAASIADLLPALIAKLGATGLAELEIRQGDLRVRIRRPVDGPGPRDRRSTDRGERPARGGHGMAPSTAVGLTAVGPGRESRDGREGRVSDARDDGRAVATSPAVGIFQPRSGARAGTRVRAGDRIGAVDMLGVLQEVVAPSDGVVGASLVEPGDAVEFGQGLVVIEFASAAPAGPGTGTHPPTPLAEG